MRCIACGQQIPPHEDCYRDMDKRVACKRCYRPGVSVARVVKDDDEGEAG